MKRSAKSLYPQMNLLLLNLPATATGDEQPNELTMALMELLIRAAEEENAYEGNQQAGNGGEDESETHAGTTSAKSHRLRSPVPTQSINSQPGKSGGPSKSCEHSGLNIQLGTGYILPSDSIGRAGEKSAN